jgi:hypothetical protein
MSYPSIADLHPRSTRTETLHAYQQAGHLPAMATVEDLHQGHFLHGPFQQMLGLEQVLAFLDELDADAARLEGPGATCGKARAARGALRIQEEAARILGFTPADPRRPVASLADKGRRACCGCHLPLCYALRDPSTPRALQGP